MSDTTNLADLPSDPTVGGGQNVVLQTTDKPTNYDPNVGIPNTSNNSSEINEQKIMNEVVTGIQQASASGGTGLPSRDIPTNTVHFADDQVKPNYVPQQEEPDYIHNTGTEQDILARRMKNQNSRDSLEILYDEFQIPIIFTLNEKDTAKYLNVLAKKQTKSESSIRASKIFLSEKCLNNVSLATPRR